MSTFINLGFETAGPAPGEADGWTIETQASVEEIAEYGPSRKPEESFEEGYVGNQDALFELHDGDLNVAQYDSAIAPPVSAEPFEDFEEGYDLNQSFVDEIVSPAPAEYDSVPEPVEDFEEEWDNNEAAIYLFTKPLVRVLSAESGGYTVKIYGRDFIYVATVPPDVEVDIASALAAEINLDPVVPVVASPVGNTVELTPDSPQSPLDLEVLGPTTDSIVVGTFSSDTILDAADYDTVVEPMEDFEEGWRNDTLEQSLTSTEAAAYDGTSPENVEDFEETFFDKVFVANPATNTFTSNGHGLSNGDKVTVRNENGQLPAGLNLATIYFVVSATTNTFKLSATAGGAAIDVTDAGTGTHFVAGDPERFWLTAMATL